MPLTDITDTRKMDKRSDGVWHKTLPVRQRNRIAHVNSTCGCTFMHKMKVQKPLRCLTTTVFFSLLFWVQFSLFLPTWSSLVSSILSGNRKQNQHTCIFWLVLFCTEEVVICVFNFYHCCLKSNKFTKNQTSMCVLKVRWLIVKNKLL